MFLIKASVLLTLLAVIPAAQAAALPLDERYNEALSIPVQVKAPVTALEKASPFDAVFALPANTLVTFNSHDAPAARPGCATAKRVKGASLIVGGKSRCQGGHLSSAEQAIIVFDATAHRRSAAAALALQEDPRSVSQPPLAASAGLAMPLNSFAHIGFEYSFSQEGDLSPFHFSSTSGAMDDNVGHSATLRVELHL